MFKSIALTSLLIRSANGAGCYPAWSSGSEYSSGSLVSAIRVVNATAGTTVTKNFKCTSGTETALSHCPTYDPANTVQAAAAWSDLGECSGTEPIVTPSPTSKPTHAAWSGVGCPDEWASGNSYEGGDIAAVDGVVYQCSSQQAVNLWCGLDNYKPGDSVHWASAWTLFGSCDGTIRPTTSPVYVSLADAGGCPDAYDSSATYEGGDKVAVEGIVYQCSSDVHQSRFCSQYEPGNDFKLGWSVAGYCEGTIAPSTAPAFASLTDHNGCPNEYSDAAEYEASDKVAVSITDTHSVVYQCSSDVHQSRYCSDYEPGNDYKLGWTLIGYCDGTIAPTTAPAFSSLTDVGDGCPKGYDVSTTYESGDQVSVFVSGTDAGQAVIYECKTWPNGAYCNAGPNFSPESDNANLGWTLKGYCDGTIAPTAAPVVYAPVAKCRWYNGTQPVTINNWAAGALSTYVAGTRIRKDTNIYKCKGYPYSLWCKMAAYEPENTAYWADAWTPAGTCVDMFAPTTSPSVSPTTSPSASPTVSPTASPSTSPTASPSASPTTTPTASPSTSPTASPSLSPSTSPTASPSTSPTNSPSASPSTSPTTSPSSSPSTSPTKAPSTSPTASPTKAPSTSPVVAPP